MLSRSDLTPNITPEDNLSGLSRSDLTPNIPPEDNLSVLSRSDLTRNITPRGQPIWAFPIRSDPQYNPQRTTYLGFPDQIWSPIYPPEDNLSGLSRSDLTPNIPPRGQPICAFPIRSDTQYTPQRTTYLGFPDQIWHPIYPPEDNLSGLSRSDLTPNIPPRGQPISAFPIRSDTQYNPQRTTYQCFPDQIWHPIYPPEDNLSVLSRSDLTPNIPPRGQPIWAFPNRSDPQYNPQRTTYQCFPDQIWHPIYPPEDNLSVLSRSDLTPNIPPRGQPIWAFPIRSDPQYNPQRTTYLCFPDQIWHPIYPPEDNLSGLSRSDLTPNIPPRGQPIWAFPIRSDTQYTPQRTTYLGFPDQIWPPIYPPEDNLSGLSRSDLTPNITPRGQPICAFPIRSDTQYTPQRTTYLGFPDQIWHPIYPPEDNLSGLSRSDLTPNITPRGQPICAFPIRSDTQYTPQRTTYLGFPDQIWHPIYPPEDNLSGLSRSDLTPNITPEDNLSVLSRQKRLGICRGAGDAVIGRKPYRCLSHHMRQRLRWQAGLFCIALSHIWVILH